MKSTHENFYLGTSPEEKALALSNLLGRRNRIRTLITSVLVKKSMQIPDVENIIMDTIARLLEKPAITDRLPECATINDVLAFLTRVTYFQQKGFVRNFYGSRGEARERCRPVSIDNQLHGTLVSNTPSPLEAAMLQEFCDDLDDIQTELTGPQQELLEKHYFKGMTYAEIAQERGNQRGTVCNKGTLLKKKLQKLLTGHK